MKKEKDPAFLFYPQAFMEGVYFMSDEQIGRYVKVLCLQHQAGHLTDKQISKVLHDDDIEVFEKLRQDEDGKWYNVKLDQEVERRKNYSEYQSELAKRRWNKDAKASSKKDANASAKQMPNDMPNECMRTKTETKTRKYLSTIESSTPNRLFKEETEPQTYNSLEDLYESL